MKELSKIALAVQPSATLAIDTMFKQMRADGLDVIGFGAGEPDFPTPDHIKEAGIQAIQNNDTKYTPSAGTVELRKAVCQRLKEDCGVDYEPSQISVSSGAKPCVYTALRALVDPGDEVILPAPYWVSYIELIRMVGGVPVVVEASEAEHFKITPEKLVAAITPKTKCMILNNPCNPTGAVMEREDLEAIAEVLRGTNIMVLSDEIYAELTYGLERHISIATLPGMKERTIVVNGFSKAYAMTGWRLGYAVGPEPVIKVMTKIHQSCIMSAPTTSQYAAIAALHSCDDSIEMMRDEYNRRRRYVVKALNDMGLTCFEPRGAFYVFPCIRCSGLTSQEFCEMLLKEQEVAIIPGDAFGASGEGYARISYAYSVEHLETAMRRIRTFLKDHGWLAE